MNQTGFRVSSDNLSADLFTYLSRGLTAESGLRAEVRYMLSFDVRFPSPFAAGLVGAGSPPAESTLFKAGAIPREPELEEVDQRLYINAKKGVDQPDRDLSFGGDIRNGGSDDVLSYFRIIRREVAHANPVQTDDTCRLWLVIGTDTGFAGRTTLYYTSVTTRLKSISD